MALRTSHTLSLWSKEKDTATTQDMAKISVPALTLIMLCTLVLFSSEAAALRRGEDHGTALLLFLLLLLLIVVFLLQLLLLYSVV